MKKNIQSDFLYDECLFCAVMSQEILQMIWKKQLAMWKEIFKITLYVNPSKDQFLN